MKISCQSCGAKYNIADEKVRGKIVKIACKKCGARIEIDGREPEAQAHDQDETRVYDNAQGAGGPAAGADVWTVSVDDNDQREIPTAQLLDLYRQGVVSGDTFVWREGMGDWQTIRDVDALRELLAQPAQTSVPPQDFQSAPSFHPEAAQQSPAHTNGGGGYGQQPQAYAQTQQAGGYGQQQEVQGAAGGYPSPSIETAQQAARLGGSRRGGAVDLFAAPGTQQEDDDVATSAPTAGAALAAGPMGAVAGSGKPIGARNENSVLFSLSALTASGPAPAAQLGGGDDEKSGLIDIQKLAAAGRPQGAGGDNRAKLDDIMNLGGGGAFGAALGAPILAPPPPTAMLEGSQDEGKKKASPLIFALIGIGVVIIGLLIFLVLKKGDDTSAKTTPSGQTLSGTGTAPTGTTPGGTGTGASTVAVADTTTTTNTAAGTADTTAPIGSGTGGTASTKAIPGSTGTKAVPGGTATTKDTSTAKTADTATTAKPPSGACTSLDCMMGSKTGAPPATTTAPPAGGGAQFDKDAARASLSSIPYKDCGSGGSGSVVVTFAPSGNASASVAGDGLDGGTKACVAGRFSKAHVPPFSGAAHSVGWKISL